MDGWGGWVSFFCVFFGGRKLGVAYTQMICFDTDRARLRELARLGATTVLVRNGLTVEVLAQVSGLIEATGKWFGFEGVLASAPE